MNKHFEKKKIDEQIGTKRVPSTCDLVSENMYTFIIPVITTKIGFNNLKIFVFRIHGF